MFIETEPTPNPNTLKFILDRPVLNTGTFHFTSPETARVSPLAETLFGFSEVSEVLLTSSFVSVSLQDKTWEEMKPQILAALLEFFTSGRPVVTEDAVNQPLEISQDSKIVSDIKTILDEKVRPAVARDGGDITFAKFENGVVYLHLQGACSGCPSSLFTLKQGVEKLLKYYLPEVLEVRAI